MKGHQRVADLDLDNLTYGDAIEWLDLYLDKIGLRKASTVVLPYDLSFEVAKISSFDASSEAEALTALSAWFSLADGFISELAVRQAGHSPGPGPVRCWPHHFDISTYVGLTEGDPETAKGIGVGMSPGDESYDQPYFYVNPWPHLNADHLSDLPAPGHWHTDGFVGAIATAEEVLSLDDIAGQLPVFLNGALAMGLDAQ